jgi:hypothetical protein
MNFPSSCSGIALLCMAVTACSQAESHNASTTADAVIGILQCDDYLAKVATCIQEKVPAGQRARLTIEAHEMFAIWKEAAADPQHRTTLPQACAITHDVAREELAGFGCAL